MLDKIWIFDTYSICIALGVIACFITFEIFMKRKYKASSNTRTNYEILALISIIIGFAFAMLFQAIYDLIGKNKELSGAMTFYGGLIGGVITFVVLYKVYYYKKVDVGISKVCIIAPACISIAHSFGRIGCFMAGCCYGKETDSFWGVKFPDLEKKVYPTQLFEAFFLLLLFIVLFYLAMKINFEYNFTIYLISYGIFRFLIEFLRGDERGFTILGLSPSQYISILFVIAGIIYFIVMKKKKASVLN